MVHPIAEASETSLFGSRTASEFYAHHSVSHSSQHIINSTGLKLFTQSWVPLPPTKIIGTLCVLHGFKENSSWIVQLTAVHFAKAGLATCAIDYQGHGDSEGIRDHIPDINPVVQDCSSFFDTFRSKYPDSLPSFLYGESLGGSIALLIHLNNTADQKPWNGIVLHGAMCKISKKFLPPWPLVHFSPFLAKVVPRLKVVPTKSIPHLSYHEKWKRKLALACPIRGKGLPRPATSYEFLRLTKEIRKRFEEVVAPILIVHGGADAICDPRGSKELYEQSTSKDKTLRVYEGMWHLMAGESNEDVAMVFGEIVRWFLDRAQPVDNNV
ncbi:acylglycerol lipase [Ranunculus cassubicifolius]